MSRTATPLYRELASLVAARLNCRKAGNSEWEGRHGDSLRRLVFSFMPSGGGIEGWWRMTITWHTGVEGAIGALFASVVVGLCLRKVLLPDTDVFLVLSLCVFTSIVAQLGDLCESMIKRSFHSKD